MSIEVRKERVEEGDLVILYEGYGSVKVCSLFDFPFLRSTSHEGF